MLAAGSVILTVVFADQTLATVLEATRIRTAIGPSQAWYTENLRYYYLILPTVDGSLSRRFGFLITALCLFTAVFIMLRRKRVRGVARGPAWRLMGVIFGTMFFLMFTPNQMGAPLRAVRRGRGGDGRVDHGAGVAGGAALVA
jgi:arabinosyltransferase B